MKRFYLIFFIFSILLIPFGVSAAGGGLDLGCIQQKLLDPTFVCDPNLNPGSTITSRPADYTQCTTRLCTVDEKCYEMDLTPAGGGPVVQVYECFAYRDPTGTQCGGPCNASINEECILLNPVESLSGMFAPPQAQNWRCINPDVERLNLFGVDLGPVNFFVPRFIRLVFTVVLVLIGVVLLWNMFGSIWEYTTTNDKSSIENVQKKIVNMFIGVFFIGAAIAIVQIVSLAFGISGNIFDFTYP